MGLSTVRVRESVGVRVGVCARVCARTPSSARVATVASFQRIHIGMTSLSLERNNRGNNTRNGWPEVGVVRSYFGVSAHLDVVTDVLVVLLMLTMSLGLFSLDHWLR